MIRSFLAHTPNPSRIIREAILGALLLAGLAAQAQSPSLTVDVSQPGPKISPMLYGIFFEEINHAGDGGLYAELVRNRNFDDAKTAVSWELQTRGTAQGKMGLCTEKPLNPNRSNSLQIDATEARDGGQVCAVNGGFWGMGLKKDAKYRLALFARCSDGYKGGLEISLAGLGETYAKGTIKGLATEWKRYECELKSGAATGAAQLAIGVNAPGTVWLTCVSLFPVDTWKGRPNGLRPDLAEKLVEMKPAFNRFPGGCYVEGGSWLRDAFRWKTTVVPIEERPGHLNEPWAYRSTDGLGYHEYLQMSEDLGAEPLYVCNVGMSHRENCPMDKLDEWVQEALDAIEYSNGPESSKWGAVRAKNGHPKSFNMKYMEIGNENGGPAYEERYAVFYKAIKDKYPDMHLIANIHVKKSPCEIQDDHYYNSPEWFRKNAGLYDKRDRSAPKVFVGEYACTAGVGKGNLKGALAEAAFMMGFERNSESIVLAAYAPLFWHIKDRKWPVNLIGFDATRCFGTPSYYTQVLMAQNRGDVVLPSKLESAEEKYSTAIERGAIGLGTWLTKAEYKDIKVTQGDKVLYESDFTKGAQGWRVLKGDWKAVDGAYRQSADGDDMRAVCGDPNWTDYVLTLKARKISGAEGFLIMFRVKDNANWLWLNVGGWSNSVTAIERSFRGEKSRLPGDGPGGIQNGRWYDIKVDVKGARVECFLDGKSIIKIDNMYDEKSMTAMNAIATRVEKTGEILVKVANFTDQPQKTAIKLNGAGKIAPEGTAIVLTSDKVEDENTVEEPTKVAPVTQKAKGLGAEFEYTFAPNSLTILRLQPK